MQTKIRLGALIALIGAAAGLTAADAVAADAEPFGPKIMEEVVVTAKRPQSDAESTFSAGAREKIERLNAAMVMEEVVVTAERPQSDARSTLSESAREKIEKLNAAMVMEEVVVTAPRPPRVLASLEGDATEQGKARADGSRPPGTLRF